MCKCSKLLGIVILVLTGIVHAQLPLTIDNISVTASSLYGDNTPAIRVIDESGMMNDLHDNNSSGTTMWLSGNGQSASSANEFTEIGYAWISFEFDKVYELASLWVWNFNQDSSGWLAWTRGFKNVSIEYSADGVNWAKLGEFTFAAADGNYGYAHNTEIALQSIEAKYFVITAHTTDGYYTTQDIGAGLSEVRFFADVKEATGYSPIDNAIGQPQDVTLSWINGSQTLQANGSGVYFGDDYNAVDTATESSGEFQGFVSGSEYVADSLTDGKTYYWRVDQYDNSTSANIFKGKVNAFIVGHDIYRFNGAVSRDTLESYLARSITQADFCKTNIFEDNIDYLLNIGAKFICRAAIAWDVPHSPVDYNMADEEYYYYTIEKYAKRMIAIDNEVILQGTIFETAYSAYSVETPDRVASGFSGAGVEQIPIPAWVFTEFGLPVEQRNFSYENMIYSDGYGRNHWLPGASIPDITQLEAKMWFYYRGKRYIDAGFESLHFGQVHLMAKDDTAHAAWYDVIGRIRSYASTNARRGFVLCDAHAGNGIAENGQLLMDLNLMPIRPRENCNATSGEYETFLEFGWIDSLYGNSVGGITPSGWSCNSLPYNVEFDNSGAQDPGVCGGTAQHWPWGWDEITWFAHCSNDYRNYWLDYATDWLKKNDAIGYIRMPGRTTIQADPIDDIWHYQANMPKSNSPEGFGQELEIKKLWQNNGKQNMNSFTLTEQHLQDTQDSSWTARWDDTMQVGIDSGTIEVVASSMAYGQIASVADSNSGSHGGFGFGIPADNVNFVNGDIDIKFKENYTLGRVLKCIKVFVAGAVDQRRFYDLEFLYSTCKDSDDFNLIARVSATDEDSLSVGTSSIITLEDNGIGEVANVHTIKIRTYVSNEKLNQEYNKYVATAFIEIDLDMYDLVDVNFDNEVDLEDFSAVGYEWLDESQISVINDSFEVPDIRDGRLQTVLLSDWVVEGYVKLFDPSIAQFNELYKEGEQIPDGEQVSYLTNSIINQQTNEFVKRNKIYELSVNVGMPLGVSGSVFSLELVAFDDTSQISLGKIEAIEKYYSNEENLPLEKGAWSLQRLLFDSSQVPQVVGKQIAIIISGNLVHIDKVSLVSLGQSDFDIDGLVDSDDLMRLLNDWLK